MKSSAGADCSISRAKYWPVFRQAIRLIGASRVVSLDIELDVRQDPRSDPWGSYFASRFAWGDESAELWRSVGLTSQATEAKNIEAPHFVEVRAEKSRVAILTGGWPYHRRVGPRMLDSLLVVRGETSRRFQLAVGVGLAHPVHAALDLLSPAVVVPAAAAPAAPAAPAGCLTWMSRTSSPRTGSRSAILQAATPHCQVETSASACGYWKPKVKRARFTCVPASRCRRRGTSTSKGGLWPNSPSRATA